MSASDAYVLRDHVWTADKRKDAHAVRHYARSWRAWRKGDESYLHRLLLPGVCPDHINSDGLDNRRENLRPASSSENAANQRKRQGTSSRFKGVHFYKRHGRWSAHIQYQGRQHFLGYFDSEQAAADAYDREAVKMFGSFARTNGGTVNPSAA